MNKKNKILYLPSFSKELNEILYYITFNLENKHAAENLLNKIQDAIVNRSINPESYETYNSIKNRKYKWYRIYVDNYTIFYTVKDSTMTVAHIIYSKRNFDKLI